MNCMMKLCLFFASMAGMMNGSIGAAICTDPDGPVLHQQWINTHFASHEEQHPSNYIHPALRSAKDSMIDQSTRKYATHTPFTADSDKEKRCPNQPSQGMNDELALRSTCPWYYVTNHDENRYPRDMMEVECACSDACSGITTTSGLAHCEKAYYNVPVLRRDTCNETSGRYTWVQGWQRLATACVCAMRQTA